MSQSSALARVSSVVAAHNEARSVVGATGPIRRTKLTELRDTRAAADIVASRDAARSLLRSSERARHDEARRLFARMETIHAAIRATDDDARRARLELLLGDVESARDRYMNATWQQVATSEDWAPRGRFANYARRFDLGFISMSSEDISQEAAELLAIAHQLDPKLPIGELTATGARTMSHTIGEGYRAIRHAYRRGLGFYGYERRGTVVERDASERGYYTTESFTLTELRWRGEDESAIRAALTLAIDADELDDDELDDDQLAMLEQVERRRAGLATLTRRFPLNADGRMLALATLLTEGYSIGDTADALGMTPATLERWANELGALVA